MERRHFLRILIGAPLLILMIGASIAYSRETSFSATDPVVRAPLIVTTNTVQDLPQDLELDKEYTFQVAISNPNSHKVLVKFTGHNTTQLWALKIAGKIPKLPLINVLFANGSSRSVPLDELKSKWITGVDAVTANGTAIVIEKLLDGNVIQPYQTILIRIRIHIPLSTLFYMQTGSGFVLDENGFPRTVRYEMNGGEHISLARGLVQSGYE